jgi:putative oxidoreductase
VADSIASRVRRSDALIWALRILLAVLFLYQGIDKFSERQLWLRIFEEIGFGQWFRYFTGVVKISGGLMLLIPKATLVAVGLSVCTMIGALLVHVLVIGVGPQTVFVCILVLMLCIIGAKRANWREPKRGSRPRQGAVTRKQTTKRPHHSAARWSASIWLSHCPIEVPTGECLARRDG